MALIEHLERQDWQQFFSDTFGYVLYVLKEDRSRHVGGSADDLRIWLVKGGIPRVRKHLNDQMEMRRFPEAHKAAVFACLERLVRENRSALLELIVKQVIPAVREKWLPLDDAPESDFDDIIDRIIAGERPFSEWMHARGYTDKHIAEIYGIIDRCLMEQGIAPPPPYLPKAN